nr:immunoglobulin heavy chain junction region [Mus musculus]
CARRDDYGGWFAYW